jgi:hypothetical protein
MYRREIASAAVMLSVLVGRSAIASDRIELTDNSYVQAAMPVEAELDSVNETFFTYQPAPQSSQDPTPNAASDAARTGASRATRPSARSSYARLARAPNMFGDSLGSGGQLAENAAIFFIPAGGNQVIECRCGTGDAMDLPGIGGGVLKVGENNKPLPMDRVYFVFNGFQNALTVGQPVPRDLNISRYTVGLEKTFADGLWSLNVGMPFTNSLDINTTAFTVDSDSIGNLSLFLKRLAYSDDTSAISAGLGISLPTGSDLAIQTHQFNPIRAQTDFQNILVQNQAVHLVPYVGYLSMPSDDWFYQAFLSFDFAANGNRVDLGPATVGRLNQQNLMHVDLSLGRWLVQVPDAYYLRGVAAVAELHFTSTIQSTDRVIFPTQPDTGPLINAQLTNLANQTDMLNVTGGFQMQIGEMSNLRVAGVAPLQERPYREFDFEIQVSFNRNF